MVCELGTSESVQNGFAFSYFFWKGKRTIAFELNAGRAIVGTAWKNLHWNGCRFRCGTHGNSGWFVTPKSGPVSNPVTFVATQGNVSRCDTVPIIWPAKPMFWANRMPRQTDTI